MRPSRIDCLTFRILFAGASAAGGQAYAQALLTHPIDWYVGHPIALQNALIQCNTENGLIGTQDCRNAIVAAHILATRPAGPGGTPSKSAG
jgi:hypothetical protein